MGVVMQFTRCRKCARLRGLLGSADYECDDCLHRRDARSLRRLQGPDPRYLFDFAALVALVVCIVAGLVLGWR